ncbi:MAG: hypothetical protein ACTSSP_11515 [Candidatus Asgardarchaeia archaeon]
MKASEVIKKIQEKIDQWGDLELEIIKIEGDMVESSRPISGICSDGEVAIYIEYRQMRCPVCKRTWATTDEKGPTTVICGPCNAEARISAKVSATVDAIRAKRKKIKKKRKI